MELQSIYIKGMVCNRCLITIQTSLEQLGHIPVTLALGEVSFLAHENFEWSTLEERLRSLGFALLEDKKLKMTKEIKQLISEVYGGDYDFPEHFRFTNLIRQRFQKDYSTISEVFIATEKKTIEQYIIEYRINKVKEYLVYTPLTLADIAFKLNFNSVAHLSSQFKQYTGLTPSFFKEIRKQKDNTALI